MFKTVLSFVFVLAFCVSSSLYAQQLPHVHVDGRPAAGGKSIWLQNWQDAGSRFDNPKSTTTQFIPLNVVFVSDDSGNNTIDPVAFLRTMALLNSDFRPMNIRFFIADDFKYVRSSVWDEHDFTAGRQMMNANNVRDRFNTYIVTDPAGACGYYSPSGDAVALGKDCLGTGDRTWSHEAGHFFSLPHPFYGWEAFEDEDIDERDWSEPAPETIFFRGENVEVEYADGSNCQTAADGFCDTPADYLFDRWGCNSQGFYRDSLTDPTGERFAVLGDNIMSYALDNCVERFTEDQKTAMLANIAQVRTTLVNNSGTDTLPADAANLDNLLPLDGERLVYYDSVRLEWSNVEHADFYIVQLNNNPNLNGTVLSSFITSDTFAVLRDLNRRLPYYWRVRPFNRYAVESDFGETWQFRTGTRLTNTIDPGFDAALIVAPNPVNGGRELRVEGRELEAGGNLNLELFDASGRVLQQRRNIRVTAAGFNERLPTDDLTPGVYFLRLRLDDRLVTRRVIITP